MCTLVLSPRTGTVTGEGDLGIHVADAAKSVVACCVATNGELESANRELRKC